MVFSSPLKAGTRTAVLKSTDISDEQAINEHISKLESEAWSAGFIVDVKSVTAVKANVVILYTLSEDASFFPPM